MPRVGVHEFINLAKVIASGRLMYQADDAGAFTKRFEAALEVKIGVKHALAINTGTSGLISALIAAGVGPGDEVLVPAYTWVSTAIAPLAVGAVPILVEIDDTLTIDVYDLEKKITPYTKAIIPVHMLNLVCNMDEINRIARINKLIVIEDACQSVGVIYKGKRVGSIGDLGVFSFNHYKNLSSGEGGALLTNNSEFYERALVYHDVGSYSEKFAGTEYDFVGCNLRISELSGAVLLAQLRRLDPWIEKMKRRRRGATELFRKITAGRLSPHHDPENAVGLTYLFDEIEGAKRFSASNPHVVRIGDIKRHDYVSWLPVLQNCRANPRKDPFKWANRSIEYTPEMCPKTIEILNRSCLVSLN